MKLPQAVVAAYGWGLAGTMQSTCPRAPVEEAAEIRQPRPIVLSVLGATRAGASCSRALGRRPPPILPAAGPEESHLPLILTSLFACRAGHAPIRSPCGEAETTGQIPALRPRLVRNRVRSSPYLSCDQTSDSVERLQGKTELSPGCPTIIARQQHPKSLQPSQMC